MHRTDFLKDCLIFLGTGEEKNIYFILYYFMLFIYFVLFYLFMLVI